MLQANPESSLKHPSRKMDTAKSDRTKAIAKSREEMLSLLHDMPESDYELSLSDIVDDKSGTGTETSLDKEKDEKNLHKGKERKRSNSGKSFRCSSDGVLLNFYTPTSLTRSLTTPRGKQMMMSRTNSVNCTKRDNEKLLKFIGCWPSLWDRRGSKSKRRTQEQNQFEFDNSK
ncbi:hypothetical protein LUZ63_010260 [Rhynchospora breviuscula]|uniref:Uncharacterized protein n=1 Tax=Rhynchospora breviuscula TaxID=2022672 RepID=A0A9Q0CH28_9POAL|nr:hypothetical protein LUZ63_010260 [Rhynchospora breviuscula]